MNMNELLEISFKSNASDLHLSPNQTPLLRINGELNPIPDMPY